MSDPVKNAKGNLKIFFGFAAGVGKTYAMLEEAQALFKSGVDVLVGYIEPHTRPETMELLEGLPVLATKSIIYRNIKLQELDTDAALRRKPQLILVDELAHTNAAGLRNKKRYQDIEELLNAGIDVFTTVNVQHIESLNNTVEDITKIKVRETIPDYIFDQADKVRLIDIEPVELLKRIADGKVYRAERAETAMANFFTVDNLNMLREIALRKAADKISSETDEKLYADKMPSNKFLVCIGPSPSSAKCIRWTARAADAFHVPWVAVYVRTAESEQFDEKQKKNIDFNINLAERLGAEVVTLTGHDIASTVAEYAKLSSITNVVVGKSGAIKRMFEQSLNDKFIKLLPNVEIHIVANTNIVRAYRKPVRLLPWQQISFSSADALKTAFFLVAATLLSWVLRELHVGAHNLIIVYILSVLVISRSTAGYVYGIAASVLSVILFNFFFMEPYFTLRSIRADSPITFSIMFIVAIVTSALTARIQTQVKLAAERERRTSELYEINKKLITTRGESNIVDLINEYIVKLFSRSVIFYTSEPEPENDDSGFILLADDGTEKALLYSENESAVAEWVFVNQKPAGSGTDTLSGAKAFYVPVISQGKVLGVFGVSCVQGELSHNNRLFLHTIASLAAMALERQILSDEQKQATVDTERKKIKKNLFKSISHDLYKPLTGIVNVSSMILEDNYLFDKPSHDKLITKIKDDSQWLIRIIENLTFVTNLSDDKSSVKKTRHDVEDIVSGALGYIEKRYPGRNVAVKIYDKHLIVAMDGPLIEQVIINLLENVLDNSSGDSAEIAVQKKGDNAVFEVVNNSESISDAELHYLFDGDKITADIPEDGLGLFVAKTIIAAHNGKIEIKNKNAGSALQFSLPL
ncbi:MAG: sensor histidine kinase KdpD [Endomicrobia bacterium]|nr:sensor histidine kinase KdpD [Endomicrobiia bacterium]